MALPAPTSLAITPSDRRDQDPFQVEAEDRPPGGVALEDHLLPGLRLSAIGAQHMPRAPSRRVPVRHTVEPVSIAKVEPLTTARALRGPFDYRLPAAMEDLEVGSVVRGPFGRRRAARRRRRAGRALRAAAGAARRADRGARGRRARRSWSGSASGSPASTARRPRAACSWCCRRAPARAASGALASSSCGPRSPPPGEAALSGGERLGVKQRAVLEALRAGEMSAPRAGGRGRLRPPVLRRLEERGLIATRSSRVRRRPEPPEVGAAAAAPELLPEQAAAVDGDRRRARRRGRRPRELLLHGVTGSGKTEVYLAAVEAALARGRGRSSSSPRSASRRRRWPASGPGSATASRSCTRPSPTASATTSGGACAAARRASASGRARPSSPRSRDLGLIVIDEEHDPSYKQEGDPCYDARTVARRRAEECGAVLVAGTRDAAPGDAGWSCRGWSCRAGSTAADAAGRGARHARGRPALGPAAPRHLGGAGGGPRAGAKAIVMINRRGFAPWLTCRSCGHHWGCPNCDVSLIVHRHSGRLVCHHCAHAEPLPAACADCGSTTLSRAGAGTEQIEALLAERLAPMPVFRLDSDTAAGAAPTPASSPPSARPRARVLVGTQMVAKGHDFPEVDPERDPRRRRDPALPRLPRRGAHLRDGRPARRPQRPRRGRRRGDRPDPGPGRAQHRPRRPARRRRLPRRRDRAPPRRSATRPSRTWSGSCSRRVRGAARRGRRHELAGELRRGAARRTPTCSARRRCSASAAATAAGC